MVTLESEKRKKIIIIISTIIGLLFLGGVFSSYLKKPSYREVTLKIWGFDDPEVMSNIFDKYKKEFPHVSFQYTPKNPQDYENDLLDALSSGNGPDIFLIHNDWLPRYEDKISPFYSEKLRPRNITDYFADTVYNDFVDNNKLWALPSYIDTLALYYNKDIFNSNNIVFPPKTWQDFIRIAKKITLQDKISGQIKLAGGAIGSAKNINHFADLFNLIFLQKVSTSQKKDLKGDLEKTINFYTSFADPKSESYVWNRSLHYSIDAFDEENVGMVFNYHFQEKYFKTKNPNLNFAVAKIPQLDPKHPVNYADYWAWAVSRFSANKTEAWNFILTLTSDPFASYYLKETGKPPALRSLIKKYLDDPDLGVFCSQTLTVKNIVSKDNRVLISKLKETIERLLNGEITANEAADIIGQVFNL